VVRMVNDRCTLSLDATGEPLHRRGYRLDPGRAPLREDLARALVLASGWDSASLLVDPMCGSGTIAIEAALLAIDRAPNLDRHFALEHTALDPEGAALAAVRTAARTRIRPSQARILARDRDPRAFASTRANAERAGVLETIELEHGPLSTTLPSIERAPLRGATPRIVTNPPWGTRLGPRDDLRPLYRALGQLRRALGPDARLALAAHDRRLAYATAIDLHSAFLTRLGGLEVNAMVETEPLQTAAPVSQ
jgi:putative N6-adenine-specific DNA methylase